MDHGIDLTQLLGEDLRKEYYLPYDRFIQNNQFISHEDHQPHQDQQTSILENHHALYQQEYQTLPVHSHYSNFIPVEATSQYQEKLLPPQKKKKAKSKQLDHKPEFNIDYNPVKLKQLLDLKSIAKNSNHVVVDKSNNPISISTTGFLNGKFITNDHENCNYILASTDSLTMLASLVLQLLSLLNLTKNQDPRVISCYRRNYIQVSLNVSISGLFDSKVLRLQTSEYGYTITRVVKYFKLNILARTRSDKSSVPIFIKPSKSKKETPKANSDELIFNQIVKPEHIFSLDDEDISNSISKFFLVKKLQFNKATPNNGNLTFQNYYHLIVKLSAVVADLYYDDYVVEEFNNGLNGGGDNNEVILNELISEPIIVRGRNPHFYSERNDVLIKGRISTMKRSYDLASVEGENFNDEEEVDDEDSGCGPAQGIDDEEEEEEEEQVSEEEGSQEHSTSDQSVKDSIDLSGVKKYKYFPLSKIYYLTPINPVYFPHGTHHSFRYNT